MARLSFGDPPNPDDPDILVIQGVEYTLQPIGMRAMRLMLDRQKGLQAAATAATEDPESLTPEQTNASMDAGVEFIISNVIPEQRDQLREHIDNSVPPAMVANILKALTAELGGPDLHPTQPASSSPG